MTTSWEAVMGTVYLLSIDSEVSVSRSRYMVCSGPASKHGSDRPRYSWNHFLPTHVYASITDVRLR